MIIFTVNTKYEQNLESKSDMTIINNKFEGIYISLYMTFSRVKMTKDILNIKLYTTPDTTSCYSPL